MQQRNELTIIYHRYIMSKIEINAPEPHNPCLIARTTHTTSLATLTPSQSQPTVKNNIDNKNH